MAKSTGQTPQIARSSDRLGMAVAAVIALIVLVVYVVAQMRSVWPSGHPWIGLMWAVIAYMTLRMAVKMPNAPKWMYWITLAMSLVGGVIWMWATLVESGPAPSASPDKQALSDSKLGQLCS